EILEQKKLEEAEILRKITEKEILEQKKLEAERIRKIEEQEIFEQKRLEDAEVLRKIEEKEILEQKKLEAERLRKIEEKELLEEKRLEEAEILRKIEEQERLVEVEKLRKIEKQEMTKQKKKEEVDRQIKIEQQKILEQKRIEEIEMLKKRKDSFEIGRIQQTEFDGIAMADLEQKNKKKIENESDRILLAQLKKQEHQLENGPMQDIINNNDALQHHMNKANTNTVSNDKFNEINNLQQKAYNQKIHVEEIFQKQDNANIKVPKRESTDSEYELERKFSEKVLMTDRINKLKLTKSRENSNQNQQPNTVVFNSPPVLLNTSLYIETDSLEGYINGNVYNLDEPNENNESIFDSIKAAFRNFIDNIRNLIRDI
ncbi:hypothetical protein A3Q56_06390, partial [Intoshia linei]